MNSETSEAGPTVIAADAQRAPITGEAAGVPFVALPPAGGPRATAPVVVAWHLLDAPRTEAAFAAAVPLAGLDAWRVYFGLPLCGSRTPAGGPDALMQLVMEDAVLRLYGPVVTGAAEEFGAAFADVRRQLELGDGPVGLMGGSAGAAVAQLVLAEAGLDVRAAVLISPVVQLRRVIDATSAMFGMTYEWSAPADEIAARLDFVARARDVVAGPQQPAIRLILGEQDEACFREPAALLRDALAERHGQERADLVTVPDMVHALAAEPGMEPAPQAPHAAVVDGHAVAWFREHLTGGR